MRLWLAVARWHRLDIHVALLQAIQTVYRTRWKIYSLADLTRLIPGRAFHLFSVKNIRLFHRLFPFPYYPKKIAGVARGPRRPAKKKNFPD